MCIFLVLITEVSYAGTTDSNTTGNNHELGVRLRSFQIDCSWLFFTAAYGGSVDIDFFSFTTGRKSSLGTRLGIERTITGGTHGHTGGSPYLDYNMLLHATVPGESFRFDLLLGYSIETSEVPHYGSPKGLLKVGGELRWKVAPNVFGLLLKANGTRSKGTVGIGLYLGWDQ